MKFHEVLLKPLLSLQVARVLGKHLTSLEVYESRPHLQEKGDSLGKNQLIFLSIIFQTDKEYTFEVEFMKKDIKQEAQVELIFEFFFSIVDVQYISCICTTE